MVSSDDPRTKKRALNQGRKDLIRLIERRLRTRRCYWTRPWGHSYGGRRWITTHASNTREITRCVVCGTPCSWGAFDLYDLVDFAREHDIATDDELEPYVEIWRSS